MNHRCECCEWYTVPLAHPSNYLGVHRLLFDRFRQNAHVQRLKAASQYPRLHCRNQGLLLEVKIGASISDIYGRPQETSERRRCRVDLSRFAPNRTGAQASTLTTRCKVSPADRGLASSDRKCPTGCVSMSDSRSNLVGKNELHLIHG